MAKAKKTTAPKAPRAKKRKWTDRGGPNGNLSPADITRRNAEDAETKKASRFPPPEPVADVPEKFLQMRGEPVAGAPRRVPRTTCSCGAELEFDPNMIGHTAGNLLLRGWCVCPSCEAIVLCPVRSRPAEPDEVGAWKLSDGGRSVDAGGMRIRCEGNGRGVLELMKRIVQLPQLERMLGSAPADMDCNPETATIARAKPDARDAEVEAKAQRGAAAARDAANDLVPMTDADDPVPEDLRTIPGVHDHIFVAVGKMRVWQHVVVTAKGSGKLWYEESPGVAASVRMADGGVTWRRLTHEELKRFAPEESGTCGAPHPAGRGVCTNQAGHGGTHGFNSLTSRVEWTNSHRPDTIKERPLASAAAVVADYNTPVGAVALANEAIAKGKTGRGDDGTRCGVDNGRGKFCVIEHGHDQPGADRGTRFHSDGSTTWEVLRMPAPDPRKTAQAAEKERRAVEAQGEKAVTKAQAPRKSTPVERAAEAAGIVEPAAAKPKRTRKKKGKGEMVVHSETLGPPVEQDFLDGKVMSSNATRTAFDTSDPFADDDIASPTDADGPLPWEV